MIRKVFVYLILSLCLMIVLSGCGGSDQETTANNNGGGQAIQEETGAKGEERVFKLGHIGAETHIWTGMIDVFNEEMQKNSNGRLSLDVFPNSVLGNEPDLMRQLKSGSLDMAFITTAELTNRSSTFNALYMPFLLEGIEHTNAMAETEEGQAILHSLSADEGVHALGFNFIESRNLLMKDSFIEGLSDLSGKKIRVIPSPVIVDWWETTGAIPTPIPLAEVYVAFQQGVIDGIEMGPNAVITSKFNEISGTYTEIKHNMLTGVGLVSQQIWDELSAEDKQIITDAYEVARQHNREESIAVEEARLKEIVDAGGEVRDVANPNEIYQLAEEFYDKYAQEDELIKEFIDKAKELSSK